MVAIGTLTNKKGSMIYTPYPEPSIKLAEIMSKHSENAARITPIIRTVRVLISVSIICFESIMNARAIQVGKKVKIKLSI